MAATVAQLAQLRRMIVEPSTGTYSDAALAVYIEKFPCLDEQGEAPYILNYATVPPSHAANINWIENYDLNAAAAEIWAEKASAVATNYDFTADGGTYTRSQLYNQAMAQSRYYAARRKPQSTRAHVWPSRLTKEVIGNLPEVDDE